MSASGRSRTLVPVTPTEACSVGRVPNRPDGLGDDIVLAVSWARVNGVAAPMASMHGQGVVTWWWARARLCNPCEAQVKRTEPLRHRDVWQVYR